MIRRKTLPGGGKGRWTGSDLIYSTHMGHNEPDYDANNPIIKGGQPVVEEAYLTDAFTREAVSFIHGNRDKPFFLLLSYNAVHSPLQGRKDVMDRFGFIEDIHRRIFAAMLSNMDDSVGRVLGKLREEGLEENTLVFFLSDNGGPTRELTSSNLPLRGEKGQMYEGALRVPYMVRWKGKIPEGQIYTEPVSSVDIFATAAAISGNEHRGTIDGVDLLPYLNGEKEGRPHETLFWRQGSKTAIRKGDWKLLNMSRDTANPKWELYNLANDISETRDMITHEPAVATQLMELWEAKNAEMIPPLFR